MLGLARLQFASVQKAWDKTSEAISQICLCTIYGGAREWRRFSHRLGNTMCHLSLYQYVIQDIFHSPHRLSILDNCGF